MEFPLDRVKQPASPTDGGILPRLQKARDQMCDLYRNQPGWFTNNPAFTTNTLTRVASSIMDNVCSDKPLPPPPPTPVPGGQCPCDLYDVTFRTTFRNPTTGAVTSTNTATRRLAGAIGGLGNEDASSPGNPNRLQWFIIYNVGCSGSQGIKSFTSAGASNSVSDELISVVKVSGTDTCGNRAPQDPPPSIAPKFEFNIDMPDLRVGANIVIPVVIFKPTINFSPSLNVDFNFNIDVGGLRFNFDGDRFVGENGDINLNFNTVNQNISSSTTSINNNISSSTSTINSNTNNQLTSTRNTINSNTNTSITNAQTNINNHTATSLTTTSNIINNNTNSSLTTTTTNINNNTNTQINNLRTDINASINASAALILAQLEFIANLTGIINLDVKLALEFLARIEAKPDCPEPILPPGNPDVDDIVRPEEPKTGSNPKIQAVTIVLTRNPRKAQWGGGNGAPDKQIAGWFAWKVEGYGFSPQMPINYQQSTFIRPPNVGGYAYTLTNDARGFAIEHTLK